MSSTPGSSTAAAYPPEPIGDEGIAIAAAMLILADRAASAARGDDADPFERVDGWRLGGDAGRLALAAVGERRRAGRRHRARRSTWRW